MIDAKRWRTWAILFFLTLVNGAAAEPPVEQNKQKILDLLSKQRGAAEGVAAFAESPTTARDEFSVNASYLGSVKKSFLDIGFGKVLYKDLGRGRFAIRSRAEIQHPEKDTLYKFDLDMTFQLRGNHIEVVANESTFNEASASYRDRVEHAAPFVYLAKVLPPPGPGEEPSRLYHYLGHRYAIRYDRSEAGIEATTYRGDEIISKTFISGRDDGFNRVDKFRVPEHDLMISFVMKEASGS